MTPPAPLVDRRRVRPPTYHTEIDRRRYVRRCARITGTYVAIGVALATTALPAPGTPDHVAQAYLEARFDQDWPAAWALVCRAVHDATDLTTFAADIEYVDDYYFMPSDVDISVGDVRIDRRRAGPAYAVSLTVTSDEEGIRENWSTSGELSVVEEDGELRVCVERGGRIV